MLHLPDNQKRNLLTCQEPYHIDSHFAAVNSMGLQRARHNLGSEQQQTTNAKIY